jgi:AI-2 transport protein TqsA
MELHTVEGEIPRGDSGRLPRAMCAPVVAASIVIVIAGLRAAAPILAPLVLAAIIAIISLPALRWLVRRRVPFPLAIVATVLVDVAVLVLFALIILQAAAEFRAVAPAYLARVHELEAAALIKLQSWGYEVSAVPYREIINPEMLFSLATGAALRITEIVGVTLLVVLYLVFMLLESAGLSEKLHRAFGDRVGDLSRMTRVVADVQQYLTLKTLVSLATGVLIGASAAMLGIDFALFWGFLAFALNYVPSIGSFLAAIPAVFVALLQLGVASAAALAGIFLVVNLSIGSILDPIIVGRRLGLSTLVVLFSLIFWGWTWGIIGMFVALPLTAAAKIVMESSIGFRPMAVLLGPVPKGAIRRDVPAEGAGTP